MFTIGSLTRSRSIARSWSSRYDLLYLFYSCSPNFHLSSLLRGIFCPSSSRKRMSHQMTIDDLLVLSCTCPAFADQIVVTHLFLEFTASRSSCHLTQLRGVGVLSDDGFVQAVSSLIIDH